jgi:hypothetical protein
MKELIEFETWHGVMWLDGEDQDKTWLDGPVASVKGKSECKESDAHSLRGGGGELVKLKTLTYGFTNYTQR